MTAVFLAEWNLESLVNAFYDSLRRTDHVAVGNVDNARFDTRIIAILDTAKHTPTPNVRDFRADLMFIHGRAKCGLQHRNHARK